MAVTEAELGAILDHCRSLLDAANTFDEAARARDRTAQLARQRWEGTLRQEFDRRFQHEYDDLVARARRLRAEADDWARVWADTVNRINHERRAAAVDRVSSGRGLGESFVDILVGDDSADQIREVGAVPVPTARNRYMATGRLEQF